MEQIFESVKEIEKKISCFLSDDSEIAESIMIENAAMSLEYHVSKYLSEKKDSVLIMCGSGNNGADGYTLARRLIGKCKINLLQCEEPKSFHCKKSFENVSLIWNSFLLGVILTLVVAVAIGGLLFVQIKKLSDEIAARDALLTNVYVLKNDIKSKGLRVSFLLIIFYQF